MGRNGWWHSCNATSFEISFLAIGLRKFSLQLRQHGAMHISSQCPCQRKECLREQGNIHVWHEFDLCCRFCWPPRPGLGGWWHSCNATSFEISFLAIGLRKFSLQLRQHGAMHISSQCPCQRKECLREQGNIHIYIYRIRMNQGTFALFCSNTSILKLLKRLVSHEVSSLQLHSDATGTSNQFDCVRLIYLASGFVVHLA